MTEPLETDMLATLRDIFLSKSTLARQLALLEPTTKLARMLGGCGASCIETRSCSSDVPHGGSSAHCSRQTSGAQADEPGGFLYATSPLSR
jgi:hypothetical protein